MLARPYLLFVALVAAAAAQSPSIDPDGLPGARILGGGGRLPAAVRERFVELAGGATAEIVLVPTAGGSVDAPEAQERLRTSWQQDFPQAKFTVLHTRDRAVADTEAFVAPLRTARGVWFGGGVQKRLADAYLGTRFETELMALCARGGVVGGTSAGTAIQSKTMIQEGKDPPIVSQGFDLVPHGVVDQHFSQRQRLPRLQSVLAAHSDHFGVGVDESTAVEIQGRRLTVLGEGTATLVLAAGAGRSGRTKVFAAGEVADLVTWQRAARTRKDAPWPTVPMASPTVPKGALVLGGGGQLPQAAIARFVALAGGKDARIVVVTSAMPPGVEHQEAIASAFDGIHVDVLAVRHPRDATKAALAPLQNATGVWFTGGRQWRLVDAFSGTDAIAAFHAVLARGGVIGGSSAGATIQAEFLVRGNPLGNAEEWCDGYDRGFAFLPGCAVDQHFLTRNRTGDLQSLVAQLPQLIGIGIDENTAAVVQGSVLEVVGDSKVAIFDVRKAATAAQQQPEPVWLESGARWDLAAGERAER